MDATGKFVIPPQDAAREPFSEGLTPAAGRDDAGKYAWGYIDRTGAFGPYDVTADGRFLINQPVAEAATERNRRMFPTSLRFVLNWTEDVRRLLAPR